MKPLFMKKMKGKPELEVGGLSPKKNSMMVKRLKLKQDWLLKDFKRPWNRSQTALQLQKNYSNFWWHFQWTSILK